MDINTIFMVAFPTLTIIVAMFMMFQGLNKKIDDLRDHVYKLEIEMHKSFAELGVKMSVVEHRINKVEVDNQNTIQNLFDLVSPPTVTPSK